MALSKLPGYLGGVQGDISVLGRRLGPYSFADLSAGIEPFYSEPYENYGRLTFGGIL